MMTMILNGKTNEPIDISSYSRSLDIPNPDVRFTLDLTFTGEYSASGVEAFANYADSNITSILIKRGNTELLKTTGVVAKLTSLSESCSEEGDRYGYANIVIYEAGATPSNNS